ncbi:hypothetical protein KCP78_05865 [Salmonella enterica subsp. enterica]|nr:hypothetical protein KCP78_05865 [Salmonella enterica subsp. enterica]
MKARRKTLMIAGVMSFKHSDAEGFFRAKVAIKRPLSGALGRPLSNSAKPHAGKTLASIQSCSRRWPAVLSAGIVFGFAYS